MKNFEKLKKIICDNGKILPLEKINETTNIFNDLGYDSVLVINLIVQLENEFNFKFDFENETIENIATYGGLKKLIFEKKN